jgi:hypothetical protein
MLYFQHTLERKWCEGKSPIPGLIINIWKITFECLKAIQCKMLVKCPGHFSILGALESRAKENPSKNSP